MARFLRIIRKISFRFQSEYALHTVESLLIHPSSDNQSPLFALIIGINFYQHVPSLRGAVPDALAFKHYLRTHLSIQEQQITTLLDKEATRSKIIEAFKALKDDKRIKRGDAIVIFYAGHGSELAIPPGWKAGGAHIQALIPQDAHLFGATENAICAIPDRTIATLLESLVKEKGDNIVSVGGWSHQNYTEVP